MNQPARDVEHKLKIAAKMKHVTLALKAEFGSSLIPNTRSNRERLIELFNEHLGEHHDPKQFFFVINADDEIVQVNPAYRPHPGAVDEVASERADALKHDHAIEPATGV